MAEHSDGSIVIDTELDQSGFEAGSKELLQAIQSLTSEIKQLNAQFGSALPTQARRQMIPVAGFSSWRLR